MGRKQGGARRRRDHPVVGRAGVRACSALSPVLHHPLLALSACAAKKQRLKLRSRREASTLSFSAIMGQSHRVALETGWKQGGTRRKWDQPEPPAEQAKARLQLVLEAAAKADEALKAKERNEEEAKRRKEEDQTTLVEQVKRVKEIEAIESDSFVQQTFRSSKEVKKSVEASEVKLVPAASGPVSVAADLPSNEKEIDPSSIPTAIKYQDDNSLAHPNLFIEKADAEEKWFKRLIALRQERLMGSPHTDVSPFQAMDRMMLNMRNSMQELQRNFGNLSMDPNGHSFTSSSVMTYSKVGDEPPRVFQASTQTRQAPGGIKETRKALRDSDSGLEKMAVGHHLHDRAHVIKKSKNNKTGDEEVNQEFINMNESDAHAFDDEWQNEILKYKQGRQWCNLENTRMRSVGHENSGARELKRREKSHQCPGIERGRRSNVFVDKLNIKGSPVKISKK
ncbi:Myeloid leukemia factor 1 [Myotis davidii]|uniref:Myeloid leukemia factor 1 n=1 Tax=Myotis davidii TaxID=225400 RepID=L5MHC9_MYODS|nr:Myeloid leukemia factor 1 [Myotis davidii]